MSENDRPAQTKNFNREVGTNTRKGRFARVELDNVGIDNGRVSMKICRQKVDNGEKGCRKGRKEKKQASDSERKLNSQYLR